MDRKPAPSRAYTLLGWLALLLFVAIYGIELLPHHGAPITVRWMGRTFGRTGLILINIAMVLAFLALLPFRRSTKHIWKAQGTFVAFVIALMTEMFGWPLVVFILAPLVDVPILARPYFQALGHWPAMVGTAVSLLGLVLVALGWAKIHRAEGLVTTGIYRYMRHPQYSGILLFTLGWILHYPTLVTLLLWPVLVVAYVWLARQEERQALEDFGEAYGHYAKVTKRFIPYVA